MLKKHAIILLSITTALSACRQRQYNNTEIMTNNAPEIKVKTNINSLIALSDMCNQSLKPTDQPILNLADKKYSSGKALFLAAVAEIVYRTNSEDYNNAENYKYILTQTGFIPNEPVHDKQSGGDAIVALHRTNGKLDAILVGWTGTGSIKDAMNDAWVRGNKNTIEFPGSTIHLGMYQGFNAISGQIVTQLNTALAENLSAPILITGHSLGGAHAVLFAEYLARINDRIKLLNKDNSEPDMPLYNINAVYTFGEPRVGDKVFNASFNKHFPNTESDRRYVRVHNGHDPISHSFPVTEAIQTFRNITEVQVAELTSNILRRFVNIITIIECQRGFIPNKKTCAWAKDPSNLGFITGLLDDAAATGYVHASSYNLKLRYDDADPTKFAPEHFSLSTEEDRKNDMLYWKILEKNVDDAWFGSKEYLLNHQTAGSNGYVCNALKNYVMDNDYKTITVRPTNNK